MKVHYIKSFGELLVLTKCGLCFWPEINNYYDNDVVVSNKKKVTCKNCLKVINKESI